MAPPTNLPSWRDFNRLVVRGLADVAAPILSESLANRAADLIFTRHAEEKLPPEYQAQVLAEFLHRRYFEVIRHLDSDRPNATHLAIAWLARLGYVRAILTTNFDRVLESAFAAFEVPLECHSAPGHFRTLAADLSRFEAPGRACQLLKLHGSVENPSTLIDTLAQRKRGFAVPVVECARHLLRCGHWLFLGFSGLDLEAEPNYLGLAQESNEASGFTWLVREKTDPSPAVLRLQARYGGRGEILRGNLPDFLLNLSASFSPEVRSWIDGYVARLPSAPTAEAGRLALEQGTRAWAADLGTSTCAMSLGFLVHACAQPQVAVEVVEAVLHTLEQREPTTTRAPGFLLMKSLAANALGLLLAGLGRHEDAVQWLSQAVELARQASDDDTADRWRGNLALSLETLGRVGEARTLYQAVLAGYRERNDPATIAFGLNGFASFSIRQAQFDEGRALTAEAVDYAKQAGDERLRGTALNNLGIIAKLKEEYPLALDLFTEVEALFARLGNDEAVAAASTNRGEVLAALGQFDEAERIYRTALEINERLGRRENVAATYLSLGVLSRQRDDAAGAQRWFSQAVELYRALKDPSNEAFSLYRLASLKADAAQFAEAIELVQSGLALVADRNAAFAQDLWQLLGRANLRLGLAARAEQAYRQALALAQPRNDKRICAALSQNLGLTLLLQQRDGEAATLFAAAAEMHLALGNRNEYDYCKLCEAAVRLDERLAKLSNEGHAHSEREQQQKAAREMVALYPELIAMYERIGATQLVAAFCQSAASTAQFAGDVERAVEWYGKAAELFRTLGLSAQSMAALERCEPLLR